MANTNVNINVDAIGDTTLVAGISGEVIDVYEYYLDAALGVSAKFRDGTGGATIHGPLTMITGVPQNHRDNGTPLFTVSAGNPLVLNCSLGVQISGTIKIDQHA